MQSFALQTVLSRMGHEVSIISKSRKYEVLGWRKVYVYPWRFAKKYFFRQNVSIRQGENERVIYNANEDIRCRNIYPFLQQYLHIKYIKNFSEITPDLYDAIVVGSDQVWRACYFEQQYKESIENAFLSFTKNWTLKRYSYAASFGTDVWELDDNTTLKCAKLISLFDGISVREESGMRLCKQYLGVDSEKLIDPTLLLSKEDYAGLVGDTSNHDTDTLLVYLLDASQPAISLVNKVANDEMLTPVYMNVPWTDNLGKAITKPSVQTWLSGFVDAKFVITDSYHACIFSVIFNKPFVVLGNNERGVSRINSLLSDLGLEHHLLSQIGDYRVGSYSLNHYDIEFKLSPLKKKAIDYLASIGNE